MTLTDHELLEIGALDAEDFETLASCARVAKAWPEVADQMAAAAHAVRTDALRIARALAAQPGFEREQARRRLERATGWSLCIVCGQSHRTNAACARCGALDDHTLGEVHEALEAGGPRAAAEVGAFDALEVSGG